jgi:SAM-dependent methyltransferase
VSVPVDDRFATWIESLERRHLERLTFAEVRHGVQALTRRYVEGRANLRKGGLLDGAGKRAAFALFYAPLHYLTVAGAVAGLDLGEPAPSRIVDLGCGTGPAAAAWARAAGGRPRLVGIDRNRWALGEARWNWAHLGLRGRLLSRDLLRTDPAEMGDALVLAWTVNEIERAALDELRERLIGAARRGVRLLIVEPIARRAVPWWDVWAEAFRSAGGRADEWRFQADLPERLRLLDRAAGLDHRELTARTLYLAR